MFTVYKITNKINNKCYIGSSIHPLKRWQEHINCANNKNSDKYNYPLYQAFRKYGLDNFSFEIIRDDFLSEKEMTDFEQEMIIAFDAVNKGGYNQTLMTARTALGSENLLKYIASMSQKCAMIDINENILEIYNSYHDAARKNGLDGDAAASNIRSVCKGQTSSYLGKIYRDLDKEGNIIKKPFKPYKGRKPVVAIDIQNPMVERYFSSISEAAKELKTDRTSIGKCIAGNSRYTVVKGYIIRALDVHGNIIENEINIEQRIKEYERKGR